MPLKTSLYRKPSPGHFARRDPKRRETLSVNMISLPLGDFRHISHIGNNALTDSFGDLSFLKRGHNLFRQSSRSEQNLFLACVPPPKPPRLNLDGSEAQQSPDWSVEQKRKKCISMPLLDSDEGDDEMEKDEECQRRSSVDELHTVFASCTDGGFPERYDQSSEQTEEESCFSFSLDLGPSILDDVLQVMDKLHK